MAVNGIEIKVGQRWKLRGGETATVKEFDVYDTTYPWQFVVDGCGAGDCEWATDYGEYNQQGCEHYFDLVELISDGSAAGDDHQEVTFHALPVVDAMRGEDLEQIRADRKPAGDISGGIGDIKSDAKGSGARFNSGKIPLQLIPLRMMARYYRQTLHLDTPKAQALRALEYLANFQERGSNDSLLLAMIELGQGVWNDTARVFDYGSRKYASWNWAKGMAWSVPLACAARHLEAILLGHPDDVESGLPHRGHAGCNLVMLGTYMRTYLEGDDRPAAGLLAPAPASMAVA